MSDQIENELGDVQAALKAGTAIAKIHDVRNAPVIVVPEGYEARILDRDEIEKWDAAPSRIKTNLQFGDLDSFCRYFKEHKNADSRIFARPIDNGVFIRGTIDYHGAEPSWEDHLIFFQTQATREWNIWQNHNKKVMTQAEFAGFLEENSDLFTTPSGADLLEMVQSLEGHANISINQAIKLQNGSISLKFTEEVELKGGIASTQEGKLEIPSTIGVSIAPFEGCPRYSMTARLRYRVESHKIKLWYESVDIHLVVRTVASDMLKNVEAQTGVLPYRIAV